MTRTIKDLDTLELTPLRKDVFDIAETAYEAIDTEEMLRNMLSVSERKLSVDGRTYDLSGFSRVRVIGFGKVSCKAVQTIESLLRGHISDGIALDVQPGVCDIVDIVAGTHPYPSAQNVAVTGKIVEISKDSSENDLVIVVVSGGGSSLLCYPLDECEQGMRLFDDFKRVGATITEMNLVRRHISSVKGGGLAKHLYPATVLALVFSDIPGGHASDVASGPTYHDTSTIQDAQAILDKYRFSGYTLQETPKDEHIFKRVHNVEVVSNTKALDGMAAKARTMGYQVVNVGAGIYDEPATLIDKMLNASSPGTVVLSGGEPSIKVRTNSGTGGRCTHTALQALGKVGNGMAFLAFASDGGDNSDAAGAIADEITKKHVNSHSLSPDDALSNFDSYTFFKKSGDLVVTGPTGSNVADLFVLLHAQDK